MISEYHYYWRKLRYTNIHSLEKVSELIKLCAELVYLRLGRGTCDVCRMSKAGHSGT